MEIAVAVNQRNKILKNVCNILLSNLPSIFSQGFEYSAHCLAGCDSSFITQNQFKVWYGLIKGPFLNMLYNLLFFQFLSTTFCIFFFEFLKHQGLPVLSDVQNGQPLSLNSVAVDDWHKGLLSPTPTKSHSSSFFDAV